MRIWTIGWVCALAFPFGALAQKGVELPGEASKKVRKVNPAYAKVVDDPALPRGAVDWGFDFDWVHGCSAGGVGGGR